MEHFSPTEKEVIRLLGNKKMTIAELTKRYFHPDVVAPMNPHNYMGGVLRRIRQKCEYYKLNWTIEGQGAGRGGRVVWRSKKK